MTFTGLMIKYTPILVLFHSNTFRYFKHFYLFYVCRELEEEFPNLLSYTRFVECVPRMAAQLFSSLNPNRSLDRYSAERNGADNFLSSFIFLLASSLSLVLDIVHYAFELSVCCFLHNQIKSVENVRIFWRLGGYKKSTYSEVE